MEASGEETPRLWNLCFLLNRCNWKLGAKVHLVVEDLGGNAMECKESARTQGLDTAF